MIRNFHTLKIWIRSRAFVKSIQETTKVFPEDEKIRLAPQIRRAAVTIPSNIAEGCGRQTEKELKRFLDIALGSACEVETQIFLSNDLGFISKEKSEILIDEITQIRKMIVGFKRTIQG